MRKATVLILLLVLCGCFESLPKEIKHPQEMLAKVTATETVTIGKTTPAETSTVSPTQIIVETPAPTKEVNPYLIYGTDFSIGAITFNFEEGSLKGKSLSANMVSPKNLGDFDNTSRALKVGNGFGVIRPEQYGNLLITLHSGYNRLNDEPLEAEVLRYYLERWAVFERDTVTKLQESETVKGKLTFDNTVFDFEIKGAIRIESIFIDPDPTKILNIPENAEVVGNYEIFENLRTRNDNNNNTLLITLCGWAANELKDISENDRYSYYRYIILIEVKEET